MLYFFKILVKFRCSHELMEKHCSLNMRKLEKMASFSFLLPLQIFEEFFNLAIFLNNRIFFYYSLGMNRKNKVSAF